jgi:hypothetical protein
MSIQDSKNSTIIISELDNYNNNKNQMTTFFNFFDQKTLYHIQKNDYWNAFQYIVSKNMDVSLFITIFPKILNVTNEKNETLLFSANSTISKMLLESGAKINVISKDNDTPLTYLFKYFTGTDFFKKLNLLIDYHCFINVNNLHFMKNLSNVDVFKNALKNCDSKYLYEFFLDTFFKSNQVRVDSIDSILNEFKNRKIVLNNPPYGKFIAFAVEKDSFPLLRLLVEKNIFSFDAKIDSYLLSKEFNAIEVAKTNKNTNIEELINKIIETQHKKSKLLL